MDEVADSNSVAPTILEPVERLVRQAFFVCGAEVLTAASMIQNKGFLRFLNKLQ